MIGDRVDDLSTVLCGINVNTEGTPAERHAYDLDNRVGNVSGVEWFLVLSLGSSAECHRYDRGRNGRP